jgi:hypothetical protein
MGKLLKAAKTTITKHRVLLINSTTRARVTSSQCLLARMIMLHLLIMLTKAKKSIRISSIRLKI